MPVGPIMMGIGTVPAGVGTHVNGTFGLFGTDKISLRGHEPVPFAWYLSVFTALIMFLLVISIAEVFCKKSGSGRNDDCFPREENLTPPPPPYDLFAPPSYDTVAGDDNKKKKVIQVFVVSVDNCEDADRSAASATETITTTTTPTKP